MGNHCIKSAGELGELVERGMRVGVARIQFCIASMSMFS